jgi:hypothetical protein
MRRSLYPCALLLLFAAPAWAAGNCVSPDACRLISEVENHILSMNPQQLSAFEAAASFSLEENNSKVISRKDTTDANLTGPVLAVGDLDFTADGHPLRAIVLQTHTWTDQLVPIVCLDSFAASCGTLRLNQRISTTSNIYTFQDGDFLALSLFYIRVLRTR